MSVGVLELDYISKYVPITNTILFIVYSFLYEKQRCGLTYI